MRFALIGRHGQQKPASGDKTLWVRTAPLDIDKIPELMRARQFHKLGEYKIIEVFSSGLPRAYQTAEIMAQGHWPRIADELSPFGVFAEEAWNQFVKDGRPIGLEEMFAANPDFFGEVAVTGARFVRLRMRETPDGCAKMFMTHQPIAEVVSAELLTESTATLPFIFDKGDILVIPFDGSGHVAGEPKILKAADALKAAA